MLSNIVLNLLLIAQVAFSFVIPKVDVSHSEWVNEPLHGDILKRQSNFFTVTGAPLPADGGSVPVRHEVRDLQNNYPDQWNLYLLGLDRMMNVDQTDEL